MNGWKTRMKINVIGGGLADVKPLGRRPMPAPR